MTPEHPSIKSASCCPFSQPSCPLQRHPSHLFVKTTLHLKTYCCSLLKLYFSLLFILSFISAPYIFRLSNLNSAAGFENSTIVSQHIHTYTHCILMARCWLTSHTCVHTQTLQTLSNSYHSSSAFFSFMLSSHVFPGKAVDS